MWWHQQLKRKWQHYTSHIKRLYHYTIHSLKWVGHNHSRISKHKTQQLWDSLTKRYSTKLPIRWISICGGSKTGNHNTSSDTIGHQDLKTREITAQSIIPIFIMKQREQNHTSCKFPFLHIFQLRQTKHSCKGVLLQVELHPRGIERTSGNRIKSTILVY